MTDEEAISLIEKLRRAQPNNRELWRLLDDHELRIYSRPEKNDGPGSPSARIGIVCDFAVAKGVCTGYEGPPPEVFLLKAFEEMERKLGMEPPRPVVIQKPAKGPDSVTIPEIKAAIKAVCEACEKRKKNKAASMKKWRDKNPKPKHDRYAG